VQPNVPCATTPHALTHCMPVCVLLLFLLLLLLLLCCWTMDWTNPCQVVRQV